MPDSLEPDSVDSLIFKQSQLELDIHSELNSRPSINIETVVDDDVRRFVTNALCSGDLKDRDDDIK